MQLTRPLRVRTLTAGVEFDPSDLSEAQRTIHLLQRGRATLERAGYEVQTLRIATPPIVATLDVAGRDAVVESLIALDQLIAKAGVILSIGPVQVSDRRDDALAAWCVELLRHTRNISFSCVIGSPAVGVHKASATTAAQIMIAASQAVAEGMGNFRFAAAANIPPGTPFFPVAWHEGDDALALGVESAAVVQQAFESSEAESTPVACLRELMNYALQPLEKICTEFAAAEGKRWSGIDSSPAPAQDRSIGGAIEVFTRKPFGSAGTLEACAAITGAIKTLDVKTCGYSGLMLPVLEDPVLARRAGEARFGVRDLLLYSSVCGTGLDVVPIPGDTPVDVIAGLLIDVATLSSRLQKPLSARLFLVPGKSAGDLARFTDPLLTDCVVMRVD
ncbi:MAG: DUF711 family protein [Povalibacter sp.]